MFVIRRLYRLNWYGVPHGSAVSDSYQITYAGRKACISYLTTPQEEHYV
jgi:hypothetical protein